MLCPAERVLELYNQDSGKTAKRVSKSVRTWFEEEAYREGWTGVTFLPEVSTGHSSGCVMWKGFTPAQKVRYILRIPKR